MLILSLILLQCFNGTDNHRMPDTIYFLQILFKKLTKLKYVDSFKHLLIKKLDTMKNIIALLICIMSLTIIAEADHIRFKTYPSKLKKGLNSFTFDYSATYHSRIYIQVFDENWKQVYSYDFIAENYNSHAWANIPLKANNSSVHYVQVKLISLSRKQIGWDRLGPKKILWWFTKKWFIKRCCRSWHST